MTMTKGASAVLKGLAVALAVGALCLQCPDAFAGKKQIDWPKKLAPGYQLLDVGQTERALATFAELCQKNPAAGPPHVGLGIALKRLGKFGEAKAEFQKSIQVDPGSPDAYYELGTIQEGDKEYEAAQQNFEKYLQLAPGSNRKVAVEERIRHCREHQAGGGSD